MWEGAFASKKENPKNLWQEITCKCEMDVIQRKDETKRVEQQKKCGVNGCSNDSDNGDRDDGIE